LFLTAGPNGSAPYRSNEMTVAELREAIAQMPGHLPVIVEQNTGLGYAYALDCAPTNMGKDKGIMVLIFIENEK